MKYIIVLSFVLLLGTPAWAQEPQSDVSEPPKEESSRLQIATDRFYLATTENLIELSEHLDGFFPNPDNRRFDYRRTRVQAQLGLLVDSHGEFLVLQRISGRVVLPRMEERLSLFFSGAGEDLTRNEDNEASNLFFVPTIEATRFRFGFNTALRFVFTKSDYYLVQNQLGVRLLPTWDPYDELSAHLRIPLSKNFLWQPGQILFWRDSTGFGETTRYDLDYALGHGAIVRLHQEGTRSEVSNGYEHLHSLAYLHQLDKKRGYAVVLEARGETSPIQRMTQYLIVFTWKELVYRDWLYAETGSRLLFAYDESFDPIPALFFSLIADFDGRKSTPRPNRYREEDPPSPL